MSCTSKVSKITPIKSELGVDICKLDLNPFEISLAEYYAITMKNKRNALKLNCILMKRCGRKIQQPEMCED